MDPQLDPAGEHRHDPIVVDLEALMRARARAAAAGGAHRPRVARVPPPAVGLAAPTAPACPDRLAGAVSLPADDLTRGARFVAGDVARALEPVRRRLRALPGLRPLTHPALEGPDLDG